MGAEDGTGAGPLPLTETERIDRMRAKARDLAAELRDASDAGVSPALIVPELIAVFRETFGGDTTMQLPPLLSMFGGQS